MYQRNFSLDTERKKDRLKHLFIPLFFLLMFIEGKITFISALAEIEINGEPRQKKTFVIEELSDREFKNSLAIDLRGDKIGLLDSFGENDTVKVSLTYRAKQSNKETDRRFNSIGARKIEPLGSSSTASSSDLPF